MRFEPRVHGPRTARGALIAGLIVAVLAAAGCSPENSPTAPAIGVGVYGVVESENHVPDVGAMVLLRSHVDPVSPFKQNDLYAYQLTDGRGRFSFGAVPAAQYELLAGYAKVTVNANLPCDSLVAMATVSVADPAAPTTSLRLTLRAPGEIEGRIRAGAPATWTYMYAVGSGGIMSGSSVAPDGEFRLAGLPRGTWHVMGYQSNPTTEELVISLTIPIQLPGQTVRLEDIPIVSP